LKLYFLHASTRPLHIHDDIFGFRHPLNLLLHLSLFQLYFMELWNRATGRTSLSCAVLERFLHIFSRDIVVPKYRLQSSVTQHQLSKSSFAEASTGATCSPGARFEISGAAISRYLGAAL
jgi:hypothetical protein